jgi:DNA-binding transcriptional ArsR family regulator
MELLAEGEHASGEVVAVISREFGITQSGVSQHLKVLRDGGLATVRAEGTRRVYAVAPGPLADLDGWLGRFRHFWDQPFDALATEIARGKRARKRSAAPPRQSVAAAKDRVAATVRTRRS